MILTLVLVLACSYIIGAACLFYGFNKKTSA